MRNDCERMMECSPLPDACTNEIHEDAVLNRQQKDDDRPYIQRILVRDRNLIIACVVLAVLMNFAEGRFILYPFKIFSTWVHEMCHGLAALLTPGGRIGSLRIFKDGGGLAVTSVKSSWASNFVSSAGYPGTAVLGFLMLIFRRTNLGPTVITMFLGACMLLSVALWVRNSWGMWFLSVEGAFLLLFAWKLPAQFVDNLYNFLAATCCLNAVENVRDLFADYYQVNGEEVVNTDAHATADGWGGDYRAWATFWLWLSFTLTVAGIFLSIDARQLPGWAKGSSSTDNPSAKYYSSGGGKDYGGSSVVTSNYSRFGTPATIV